MRTQSVKVLILMAVCGFVASPQTAFAQPNQTIFNTSLPSVIRVAIRENNDPRGTITGVQTLGFQEYCKDVLPNEWVPSWSPDALRAGAIAIKMFAWYHTLHPVTIDGWTFDVDNTTNFQEYKYLSGTSDTNQAVQDTWKMVYVPSTGEVNELNYRAGTPDNPNWGFVGTEIMAQWGSQYWSAIALLPFTSILNLFYPQRKLHYI